MTGVVIFPQVPSAVSYGRSEDVVAESCALADPSLCPTILSDFEVREFPGPDIGPARGGPVATAAGPQPDRYRSATQQPGSLTMGGVFRRNTGMGAYPVTLRGLG